MKQYKLTIDFGRGPFEQIIVVKDEAEAELHCSLVADLAPFATVSFEEVSNNG